MQELRVLICGGIKIIFTINIRNVESDQVLVHRLLLTLDLCHLGEIVAPTKGTPSCQQLQLIMIKVRKVETFRFKNKIEEEIYKL